MEPQDTREHDQGNVEQPLSGDLLSYSASGGAAVHTDGTWSEGETGSELIIPSDLPPIDCPRCGVSGKPRHPVDTNLCVDCVKAENNRLTYYRQNQKDWMEKAAAAGIDPWAQQPGETQWEYTIWSAFRDTYPGKKPSYKEVAQQLNTTCNVVRKVSQRWSFPVRMQAWMVYIDQITLTQRRQEILDMNKGHIDMAKAINDKLKIAISAIVPETLAPNEIVQLGKMAAEWERKALEDTIKQEDYRRALVNGNAENPELKKSNTSQGDLEEVVSILLKAGALGDLQIATVGVRQTETTTKTTEVVATDGSGEKVVYNKLVGPESERQVVHAIIVDKENNDEE